jgi:hypothetical protein
MTISTPTRRRFIAITPIAGVALLAACSPKAEAPAPAASPAPAPAPAPAAAPTPVAAPAAAAPAAASLPMVDEKDAQATALGYVADAARVDKTKHKNFVDGSQCAGCTLYQGAAGSESGPCALFAGKAVPAKGWCASWAKKA